MRCETCAKEITKEGGELRRPILRTRDGVECPWTSLVSISALTVHTAAGTQNSLPITIPDNLIIGQLPGTSIKAHVSIRDVFINITANGTVTAFTAFVYYRDVWKRLHCVAAVNGLSSLNNYATALIVDTPITDALPIDLGDFIVTTTSFTLGTATHVDTAIVANIDIQYEQ